MIILAGEMLAAAEPHLERHLHPTTIIRWVLTGPAAPLPLAAAAAVHGLRLGKQSGGLCWAGGQALG